jgi:DNA-binding transcriptional MerR regulator
MPRRARGDLELVKMAVLARRSGVPTPTIKHYIREGLVSGPELRTSRNMAYYDARSAARIRAIKAMQAERYLPLKVIGDLLEPAPSATLRADAASQRKALTALAPAVATPRTTRRSRAQVMKSARVTRAELARLERAGVLEPRAAGYEGVDLELLDLLGELRRLGYGEVFPIDIAEAYQREVRRLIAFEVEIFRRHALGADLPAPLPEVARQALAFGQKLILGLRAKLLPKLLAQLDVVPGRARGRKRRR